MRFILPEIKELIAGKKKRVIKKVASYFEPADIADIWQELTLDEQLTLFNAVDTKFAADIFEFLKEDQMIELLNVISAEKKKEILNEMSPDDRTDLFAILPEEETAKLIPLLEEEEQLRARELLAYKQNTAGGLMTTDFITVPEDVKIGYVLRELRQKAKDIDFIQNIYVVDKVGRLKGIIPLKDLLTATPQKKVEKVMDSSFISVGLDMDQEEVAHIFEKYDEPALPVLDKLGRIKGVITVDDVLDVIQEEASEDIYHFGAAGVTEEYLSANPLHVAQKRVIWLIILALAGFISGSVLEHYSFLLSSIVTLSFFIPILMNTSGSAGTQAATVVVRGLATGEIKLSDVWQVVRKEFLIGILMGIIAGVITALRAVLLQGDVMLGFTVAVAMIIAIVIATSLGGVLPILFKRAGVDPALMSGPLIATILDTTTLLIYFNVTMLLLWRFK
ncbi:MAG TPA: magnesium transporter [candidate division WOR-3 bacterium]|uniref:Magnesium transporter MgtE n=1 Tax=candidate division WOR-3 bacterium TaxID=2052148 RepID=A0A9C9EKQ1_UNCW3|nr:magnesium transporter [candidate division WOR-3 bacterium]